MRFLTATGAVLIAAVVICLVIYYVSGIDERQARRAAKRKGPMDDIATAKAREIYLSYDDVIDAVERLLAQDESRLFLTEREQVELRGHVAHFNRITRKGSHE